MEDSNAYMVNNTKDRSDVEIDQAEGHSEEKAPRKPDLTDIVAGMTVESKSAGDITRHKFWQTQPVPRFDDQEEKEGPLKQIEKEAVPKVPAPLPEGYEWATIDITDPKELNEMYELLNGHYVEDDSETFRLRYSVSFLNWALQSPGWQKEWNVGVKACQSGRLVACITAIPIQLRIRKQTVSASEIDFLCVHRKLRSKRLAPTLIREITRRCNIFGVYQAVYTIGSMLPTPISRCRYFHRSLDWKKLYDVGFSYLPRNSTPSRQVAKFKLPNKPILPGLRAMQSNDIGVVLDLLSRYLAQYELAPDFSREELDHWLCDRAESPKDQIVWSYVVEDPATQEITDFISFYGLESSILSSQKPGHIRAAYLFYYASEYAFKKDKDEWKFRLNSLVEDALIMANKHKFDVMNAITVMDNPLFLEQQKFGPGDGQLYYYLYNYRTGPIAGGVDQENGIQERDQGGVGIYLL